MSKKKVFKRELGEREKKMYADMKNSAEDVGKENLVKGEEMRVQFVAKILVCGDETTNGNVSAITDEISFPNWK